MHLHAARHGLPATLLWMPWGSWGASLHHPACLALSLAASDLPTACHPPALQLLARMGFRGGSHGLGRQQQGMAEALTATRLKKGAGLGVDAGNKGVKQGGRTAQELPGRGERTHVGGLSVWAVTCVLLLSSGWHAANTGVPQLLCCCRLQAPAQRQAAAGGQGAPGTGGAAQRGRQGAARAGAADWQRGALCRPEFHYWRYKPGAGGQGGGSRHAQQQRGRRHGRGGSPGRREQRWRRRAGQQEGGPAQGAWQLEPLLWPSLVCAAL